MDAFTRKLLERTQARRDTLNAKLAQTPQPLPRKRRSPLKDETIAASHLNVLKDTVGDDADQISPTDDSPGKRQCLDNPCDGAEASKENAFESSTPEAVLVKSAHHTDAKTENFKKKGNIGNNTSEIKSMCDSGKSQGRASRLAALAANINNWENNVPESPRDLKEHSTVKGRPPVESCSTPPTSSCGSSLSSSASLRTPSSDVVSSNDDVPKKPGTGKITSPMNTPKLLLAKSGTNQSLAVGNELSKELSTSTPPIVCLPSSIKQVSQQQHQKQQQRTAKKVVWDQAVVATLEAQGFVKSPSKSKLEYNFQKNLNVPMTREEHQLSDASGSEEDDDVSVDAQVEGGDVRPVSHIRKCSVKDLAKKFDKPSMDLMNLPQKDPTLLPLSERVAMFERNVGDTLPLPKKPELYIHNNQAATKVQKSVCQLGDNKASNSGKANSPSKVGKNTFELHKQLFEHADKDWKSNEIATKITEDRKKDLAVVLNRWSYNKKVVDTDSSGSDNRAIYTPLSSKVPAEQVQNEDDQSSDNGPESDSNSDGWENDDQASALNEMLPSAAPSVSNDFHHLNQEKHEMESGSKETSGSEYNTSEEEDNVEPFEDEYTKDDRKESVPHIDMKAASHYCDDNVSSTDDESEENDQGLDSSILQAAFDRMRSSKVDGRQPEKVSAVRATIVEPVTVSKVCDVRRDKHEEPLIHTVSFYRRQKDMKTPVKAMIRSDGVQSPPTPDYNDYKRLNLISEEECRTQVTNKMKELQEDANAQLIIMSQTSQALNLCRSTAEFHGAAEQIEGERLLLISSHRRQACLSEIQRLKTDSALGAMPSILSAKKGSLAIGEMKLTLKREFLSQTDDGKSGEFVHYFVCLVKHRGQVVATQMVSTMDGISGGAFHLPNLIMLRELDHDFNVLFEVYGLQTKRDNINKDRKMSSSRKDKSKTALTPKKKAHKQDSRLASPGIQSPGGPSAICSTSFSLIGFTMINMKTVQRKMWDLEKVPFVSPLDGSLSMKVQCHTDHHINEEGFLTMFEDVSGFGAWHRRWFHLSHRYISYWKYPDDVKRKEPIGQIDLCQCVTSNVSLVPRDICARPHTLMLLTIRPPSEDDVDTLVSQNYNTYTATKVLLSADTKEERILWCHRFNEALENLRMWNPDALRPIPSNST